eukprot:scaffold28759_cov70-Cyclotella_meneghiniana.AAC.4
MPECAPVSAKSSLKMANFGRPLQRLHCRYWPPPAHLIPWKKVFRGITCALGWPKSAGSWFNSKWAHRHFSEDLEGRGDSRAF